MKFTGVRGMIKAKISSVEIQSPPLQILLIKHQSIVLTGYALDGMPYKYNPGIVNA